MATPSGRKKGWRPDRRTIEELSFTFTVWKDRSVPSFSVPVEYPGLEEWRNISYEYRSAVPGLLESIRLGKRFYFQKPPTLTTQLLINLFATRQLLPLVSLDYWERDDVSNGVRLFDAQIDQMYKFTIRESYRDDDDPSGLHYQMAMKAKNTDGPQGHEWTQYYRGLTQWWHGT